MDIIYANKISDIRPNQLTDQLLQETFQEAKNINQRLIAANKRVAYFFVDPLMNSFEAANRFYFGILGCEFITRLNTYKSGASPIQALSDAKELIDSNLYDAVFIFGQDLLSSDTVKYGKDEIKKAMNIFDNRTLLESYNLLAYQICVETGINKQRFFEIADRLYENYLAVYEYDGSVGSINRGRLLEDLHADLFRLTDCANPNIDFAGGIILASTATAEYLQIPDQARIQVMSARYSIVKGNPENISAIVGTKNTLLPHLRNAVTSAQSEVKIDMVQEFVQRNLMLEVYTCYPPIPIAFLLTTGLVKSIYELDEFLGNYPITITGGLNLARAPWNNPALNSLVCMYTRLPQEAARYGLVHGNGGLGEAQGVAILAKYCS